MLARNKETKPCLKLQNTHNSCNCAHWIGRGKQIHQLQRQRTAWTTRTENKYKQLLNWPKKLGQQHGCATADCTHLQGVYKQEIGKNVLLDWPKKLGQKHGCVTADCIAAQGLHVQARDMKIYWSSNGNTQFPSSIHYCIHHLRDVEEGMHNLERIQ